MKRNGLILAAIMALALSAGGAGAGDDLAADNVVIVLDSSGSMDGTMRGTKIKKMDAAKTALREVLKTVPPDVNVGLLVFSARNLENDWAYELGPRHDAELERAINEPLPGGGTPLGAYIKKGADKLLEQRNKQYGYGSYRLLIVTDGEAEDTRLVEEYTPEVMARGVTVDVIGVAMAGNHTLATKVNSYRRADDPASLKKAVAEVFAEVAGTGSDAASEDAFSALEGIPDEMAMAMVEALTESGNHPIGEKPPKPQPVTEPPPETPPSKETPPADTARKTPPQNSGSKRSGQGCLGGMFSYAQLFAFAGVYAAARTVGSRRKKSKAGPKERS